MQACHLEIDLENTFFFPSLFLNFLFYCDFTRILAERFIPGLYSYVYKTFQHKINFTFSMQFFVYNVRKDVNQLAASVSVSVSISVIIIK